MQIWQHWRISFFDFIIEVRFSENTSVLLLQLQSECVYFSCNGVFLHQGITAFAEVEDLHISCTHAQQCFQVFVVSLVTLCQLLVAVMLVH